MNGWATPPRNLHALVRRELAVPGRYHLAQVAAPLQHRSWLQRAWQWLWDRWMDLWKALFGHVKVGHGTAVAFGDVLIVVAAGAVLYAAYRLLGGFAFERSQRALSQPLETAMSAQALYELASAKARSGDYGSAMRWLFAATLAVLGLRGALRVDRSATVGDLRRSLRARDGALLPAFDTIAGGFIETAYAERSIGAQQWERADRAYRAIAVEPNA